jgi:flagellar biogenesis protein FliO
MRKTGQCFLMFFVLTAMAIPALAAEGEMATTGFRAFFFLMVIVVGLFLLAWGLKKYGPVARVKKSLGLNVLGQVALSAKANLALIRVGKSILLVGVTQNNISLIKDLEEGDFEKAIEEFQTDRGTQ